MLLNKVSSFTQALNTTYTPDLTTTFRDNFISLTGKSIIKIRPNDGKVFEFLLKNPELSFDKVEAYQSVFTRTAEIFELTKKLASILRQGQLGVCIERLPEAMQVHSITGNGSTLAIPMDIFGREYYQHVKNQLRQAQHNKESLFSFELIDGELQQTADAQEYLSFTYDKSKEALDFLLRLAKQQKNKYALRILTELSAQKTVFLEKKSLRYSLPGITLRSQEHISLIDTLLDSVAGFNSLYRCVVPVQLCVHSFEIVLMKEYLETFAPSMLKQITLVAQDIPTADFPPYALHVHPENPAYNYHLFSLRNLLTFALALPVLSVGHTVDYAVSADTTVVAKFLGPAEQQEQAAASLFALPEDWAGTPVTSYSDMNKLLYVISQQLHRYCLDSIIFTQNSQAQPLQVYLSNKFYRNEVDILTCLRPETIRYVSGGALIAFGRLDFASGTGARLIINENGVLWFFGESTDNALMLGQYTVARVSDTVEIVCVDRGTLEYRLRPDVAQARNEFDVPTTEVITSAIEFSLHSQRVVKPQRITTIKSLEDSITMDNKLKEAMQLLTHEGPIVVTDDKPQIRDEFVGYLSVYGEAVDSVQSRADIDSLLHDFGGQNPNPSVIFLDNNFQPWTRDFDYVLSAYPQLELYVKDFYGTARDGNIIPHLDFVRDGANGEARFSALCKKLGLSSDKQQALWTDFILAYDQYLTFENGHDQHKEYEYNDEGVKRLPEVVRQFPTAAIVFYVKDPIDVDRLEKITMQTGYTNVYFLQKRVTGSNIHEEDHNLLQNVSLATYNIQRVIIEIAQRRFGI